MKRVTESSKDAEKARSKALKALEQSTNRAFKPATKKDEDFFKFSIGREPDGLFAVLKHCRFGHPMAVASFPILRGEPFPTMFWLTCPHLIKVCGKLEAALFHKQLEAEIENAEKLKSDMKIAQNKMVEIRKAVAEAVDAHLESSVLESGIAGVKNPMSIKCLHAHLAAGFAGIESPVTRALYEAITSIECSENCRPEDKPE